MLEWYDLQYEHSLELDLISAFDNEPVLTYYLLQDKDYFFSKKQEDGLPANLAALVAAAVDKYITNPNFANKPEFPERVEMNMLIKEINWETLGKVAIQAEDLTQNPPISIIPCCR